MLGPDGGTGLVLGSFPKLILLKGFCFTFSNIDETNIVDGKFPRLLGLDGGTGLA